MSSVSVLILTKNEQQDLPGCLLSVGWSDDIHVYDSMSIDNTLTIANQFGAKVTQRPFDNWAAHQNWGLQNIPFKHQWVFYIDADERMTPELVREVKLAITQEKTQERGQVAFRLKRRDFFLGTWLKHVQTSSSYIRLFKPEKMRYERLVNPVSIVDGSVGELAGYLDHFPFSKGFGHWIERHNSYSQLEAQQIVTNRVDHPHGGAFSWTKALTAADFHERRYHQKELFYRLPFRPVIKFLLLYIGKLGLLDGKAGFIYAVLQSIYEYFIVLKVRELNAAATVNKNKSARSESL